MSEKPSYSFMLIDNPEGSTQLRYGNIEVKDLFDATLIAMLITLKPLRELHSDLSIKEIYAILMAQIGEEIMDKLKIIEEADK